MQRLHESMSLLIAAVLFVLLLVLLAVFALGIYWARPLFFVPGV